MWIYSICISIGRLYVCFSFKYNTTIWVYTTLRHVLCSPRELYIYLQQITMPLLQRISHFNLTLASHNVASLIYNLFYKINYIYKEVYSAAFSCTIIFISVTSLPRILLQIYGFALSYKVQQPEMCNVVHSKLDSYFKCGKENWEK